MQHKLPNTSDLAWQAFCFVTGELDAQRTAAFEERLADDQDAREAVASAMETLQLVSAAESLTPVQLPASKPAWDRSLAWMSLGAAVALLLAIGLPRLWLGASDGWRAAGLTPELAIAWSKTPGDVGQLVLPADVPSDELVDGDVADDLLGAEAPHAAPAWMLAAVRGIALDKMPDPADTQQQEN